MSDSPNAGPAIEFRNVCYRLDNGDTLLRDLNLEVQRGETLVLLGRSGSGKTTTLKLINRLLTQSAGAIYVDGRSLDAMGCDPSAPHDRLRHSGSRLVSAFHRGPQRWRSSADRGWSADRIQPRVAEMLQLVGLEPQLASRYPRELSGGQRQRVGVARALAADPAFLLMDEPFGALDPITRAELQREFLALQQRLGKTVVFVTHDLREALLLGTRIALMEAGQLVATLTPEEFLHSTDPMVAAYVDAFKTEISQRESKGHS